MKTQDAKIYLAFRFHVNMYHSYRNDTLTENGIGKDIRIINHIMRTLDLYNDRGVAVNGTWDIENYYTLEKVMPSRCPYLLEHLKERKLAGDEIEAMSYNNGILTALDNEECTLVMNEMISNKGKSGLVDVFEDFAPIIRPQECMMSPSLIPHMKNVGIAAVSLFYSSIPFTAFTNFVEPLSLHDRFNPILYKNHSNAETMTLIPAICSGDIIFHGGLEHYLKKLRTRQLNERAGDLLVVLDMDADSEFWFGYIAKYIYKNARKDAVTKGGLYRMIKAACKLPYVKFTTPYEYLKTHKPDGEIVLDLDMADGSHDGYQSWAEKYENHLVWSKIEKARYTSYKLSTYLKEHKIREPKEIKEARRKRVLALSTTHFGLSTPLMNVEKKNTANRYAQESLDLVEKAYRKAKEEDNSITLRIDNPYIYMDEGTSGIVYIDRDSSAGVKYMCDDKLLTSFKVPFANKDGLIIKNGKGKMELTKVLADESIVRHTNYRTIENDTIKLVLGQNGGISIYYKKDEFVKRAFRPVIKYNNKLYRGELVESSSFILGDCQIIKVLGNIKLPKAKMTKFEYSVTIADGLPYVYFDGYVDFPETKHKKYSKGKANKLGTTYDGRYVETMPFEIIPVFEATDENPFKVTKHNFFGDQVSFDINFGTLTKNRRLDSFNNAVTCSYIAVSNGSKGLLIAQNVEKDNSFAFCPMQVGYKLGNYTIKLNPLGTYYGKQMKNVLEKTEIVSSLVTHLAPQYASSAPSYNGKRLNAEFMLAPFYGDKPSDQLVRSAFMFSYPPTK